MAMAGQAAAFLEEDTAAARIGRLGNSSRWIKVGMGLGGLKQEMADCINLQWLELFRRP
ncbi:MAG: hypothetical protein QGH11_08795 [Pirellulaceae bacterium]|nr:hypothetical protein [Pirellulaceae bacterium]